MRLLPLALLLMACASPAPAPAPAADLPAPTPPLAEALYAGELGPQAEGLGDRVRILVWLRALDLDPTELSTLHDASLRVRAAETAAVADREAMGAQEQARLVPIYTEIAASLAKGTPDDGAADAWAKALTAAHADLPDPRRARARWIEGALDEAERWSVNLDEAQRRGMASALFFLRRRVSAELTPDLYQDLLGSPWQDGDFATLRRSRSGEQEALDPGGLFTLEGGQTDLLGNLDGLKLNVLIAIALAHPDLAPSVEVLQGRREPTDLSPAR